MASPEVDARIAEIRERAEKATPGPWSVKQPGEHSKEYIRVVDAGAPSTHGFISAGVAEVCCRRSSSEFKARTPSAREQANADFIAHARADIPFLLAQIDELRDALSRGENNGRKA